MRYISQSVLVTLVLATLAACGPVNVTQSEKDMKSTMRQQSQYAAAQPVPTYDFSLERDMVIQLYNIRNMKAVTHSVWRSDRGMVEGDCSSIGFGIPYDTSLTNPLMATNVDQDGFERGNGALTSIELPEPNGIYASKNTSATWVMCAGDNGQIEPVYVETKVTVYPYPVSVDYSTSRVSKSGAASVTIDAS